MKPIETKYRGYRMRSRLEARHAVMFDALKIRWDFEPEGFDLGAAGRYLPDFWLPDLEIWVEIKPSYPSQRERQKCHALALASGDDVFMFDRGQFGSPETDIWAPAGRDFTGTWARRFKPYAHPDDDEGDFGYWLAECMTCLVDRVRYPFVGMPSTTHWKLHSADAHAQRKDWVKGVRNTPRMLRAYEAARGARFEFGEHGGVQ